MNQICEPTNLSTPFLVKDLYPIFYPYLNTNAIQACSIRTSSLTYQWNRTINDNKYLGKQTYILGAFLNQLGLSNYADLQSSNYVQEASRVHFFGWRVSEDKIVDAAFKLTNMLNDLADKQLIRAVLTPLTTIKLSDFHVVITYFAIDLLNEPVVQSMYGNCSFQEGGVPPELK